MRHVMRYALVAFRASEIATVPGTVDLVELLFSAVLMLVDLVSWFCEPQQRGEALGACRSFFDVDGCY